MGQTEVKKDNIFSVLKHSTPDGVFSEVVRIMGKWMPDFDAGSLRTVYDDVLSLYNGNYPGYRACNTGYHDLQHTLDVFLCFSRLIHGCGIDGMKLSSRELFLGLVASLMHDTGYIQHCDDGEGTGAKFTKEHVARSIEFTRKYFRDNKFKDGDFEFTSRLIEATSLEKKMTEIPFVNDINKEMGKLLFAADIIGQMADRTYLEKLLFLFREFNEAGMPGFETEKELFEKTKDFYEYIKKRLDGEVVHYDTCFRRHFRDRLNIDDTLYIDAMNRNLKYLSVVLQDSRGRYRAMLNRGGIVKMIEDQEKAVSLSKR